MTYSEIVASPLWEGLETLSRHSGDQPPDFFVSAPGGEHRGLRFMDMAFLEAVWMQAITPEGIWTLFELPDVPAWARWLREGGEMPT